jgi:hypothetical protein
MALNTINPHTESWKTAKHFDEMQKYYARDVSSGCYQDKSLT